MDRFIRGKEETHESEVEDERVGSNSEEKWVRVNGAEEDEDTMHAIS